jgi:hypothetical protein
MANAVNKSAAQSRRCSPPPRPLPEGVIDRGHRYTLAQRIQCLILMAQGLSTTEVEQNTGVKKRQQYNIWKKAVDRSFESKSDPRILKAYIIDSERSGRPKEILKDQEEALLSAVRSNRAGREKSSKVLAYK